MTGTGYFKTILTDDRGKWRKIANKVPKGSVLVPTLFNVYISDKPETTSIKLGYADDWAITIRARVRLKQCHLIFTLTTENRRTLTISGA